MTKKAVKGANKLPKTEKEKLKFLIFNLETKVPILPKWPNYSMLGKDRYHCHLSYSWVACWECEKDSITIEVYYVGSREKSPY